MITRYPLTWPADRARTPKEKRKYALFSTRKKDTQFPYSNKRQLTISQACERIMSELRAYTRPGKDWRVDPDEVIISTNLRYRLDGLPYSNQKEPDDPGVAVYFELDGKQYCLPCDKWDRIADNLAAVAAHIAANRGIERWGVGESSDVYAGYAALPAPGQSTIFTCWNVLGIEPTKDLAAIGRAFRRKCKTAHPDAGGTADEFHELWVALQQAEQEAAAS